MQVTRGQIGGAFGKLEGSTEVPELGVPPGSGPTETSMPVLGTITMRHFESAPAHIEASGRMGDAVASLGTMRASGDIKLVLDTFVSNVGVLLGADMKMNASIKQEGFNATPNGGGTPTYYPARSSQAVDTPIVVINGNRPCDPSKDIFSYATDH